jgi:hypothetical protein
MVALQPTGNDFAMLQLVLLALLPQTGGILLMVGRSTKLATVPLIEAVSGQTQRSTPSPSNGCF